MVQLNQIPGIVLIFGIIAVIGIVMGTLANDLREGETYNSTLVNFSDEGEQGLLNMSGKLPLLGTIVILAAVIGVVVGVFRFRGGGF